VSKVWFITGAGSGIGAATARAAVKSGDRVVATGRNLDKVRRALADLVGDSVALVALDVRSETQAQAAVEAAVTAFGRIDVLVNNAGYSLLGNFEELTTEDIQGLMATNFYGVMFAMRAVLPVMRRQRSGRIINISSLAGVIGFKHCGAYSAGFFRTDLLDPANVKYAEASIGDYAPEGAAADMWSDYRGIQQGDPAKLGEVLVTIAAMADPPKQFLAGSDAVAAFKPVIEARLEELRSHEDLSRSTDGSF